IGTGAGGTATPKNISIQPGFVDGVTPTALVVTTNNRVGVGTAAPVERLEVAGNLKVSGVGNGIMFPDGSKLTSANAGGGAPSGTAIVSSINDAATVGTINDNRLAANVARLNGTNAWSGANTFAAGLSAGGAQVTNVAAPVAAADATNKGYVDSNFVK